MNVSLPKTIILTAVLLLSWEMLQAQYRIEYDLIEGGSSIHEYEYTFGIFGTNISTQPLHGTASRLQGNTPTQYYIQYIPEPGFIGQDSLVFFTSKFTFPGQGRTFFKIIYNVLPGTVDIRPDFATLQFDDVPFELDVLKNDSSTSGNLVVTDISLTSNCQASIAPGGEHLIIQPQPGFLGLAHAQYVACDYNGTCGKAMASIVVLDSNQVISDTIQLVTKKNEAIPILVPDIFELTELPLNGDFVHYWDFPYYEPLPDFSGDDYMVFSYKDKEWVYEITVLDIESNRFAFDDIISVLPGESIEVNVLANDSISNGACFDGFTQPEFGFVSQTASNGVLNYTAPEGFSGIDEFTYTLREGDCDGSAETATVKVYVSYFEPSKAKFELSTPQMTPLVIGYNAPIDNFGFLVNDQPEHGTVLVLPGYRDTVIYGQALSGYNLVVYIPDPGAVNLTDALEMAYCNYIDQGGCVSRKNVKVEIDILEVGNGQDPECFADCIWAGDTNFDGVVDVKDILPIGLYMGQNGEGRTDKDLSEWYGQYGDDWEMAFMSTQEVNLKHVDADGDSLVTTQDTLPIRQFYGRSHSLQATEVGNGDYQIIYKGDLSNIRPGDMIELSMELGTSSQPALDVYGFAFGLNYSTDFIVPESVNVQFDATSWLGYNSPALSMIHNNKGGKLDAAYSRTTGVAISGFGEIGKTRLVVAGDIDGFRPGADGKVRFQIGGKATAMNSAGQMTGIHVEPITITIDLNEAAEEVNPISGRLVGLNPRTPDHRDLKVYPNPATDQLQLYLNGGNYIRRAQVFNMAGQLMYDTGDRYQRGLEIPVRDLETGVYGVRVLSDKGVLNKKFEVARQ